MFALLGIIGLALKLLLAPLCLLVFVFWIWMLVDAILNKGLSDVEKILWVLVVFFLHFVGALIYFLFGRPKGRVAA